MFSILLSEVSHLLRFIVLVQPKSLVYPEAGRSRMKYHDRLGCTSVAILQVDFLQKKQENLCKVAKFTKVFLLGVLCALA